MSTRAWSSIPTPSAHVADEPVKTIEKNMEILLDENVDSKDDVLELGIQTGDIIAMDPRTTVTESGYIKSRFLDDKLSAAILLAWRVPSPLAR